MFTLLKTNMEPEKKSLEKEIPFGNHHFQVPCLISGEYLPNLHGVRFPGSLNRWDVGSI